MTDFSLRAPEYIEAMLAEEPRQVRPAAPVLAELEPRNGFLRPACAADVQDRRQLRAHHGGSERVRSTSPTRCPWRLAAHLGLQLYARSPQRSVDRNGGSVVLLHAAGGAP